MKSQDDAAAIWLDPKKLKPWDKNPRKNEAAIKRVADAIRRFGFGSPIVARAEDHRIIAGHTRWQASKLLGLSAVPVRLLDISEKDASLMALADNKLGEISEWDTDALGELLSEHSFKDASVAGWDWKELGSLADIEIGSANSGKSSLSADLTYSIVIECDNEEHQTELLERLESDGLNCKPLIS